MLHQKEPINETDFGSDRQSNIATGSDCIEPTVKEKNVKRMTFVLIFVIVFGIAMIWFMNKKSTPATANAVMSDQQLQIEVTIAKLTGMKHEATGKLEEVVKKFYEMTDFKQVEIKQLARNPFLHSWSFPSTTADSGDIPTAGSAAGQFQLKSILESKYGNCCMINDSLLYEGDKIMDMTIVEINTGFVTLKSETSEVTLRFSTK
ncbi:MAG: hypothetical protein K8R02_08360 [Anaerohalosphaeraceae bacterium]|nr:hypothetical protein [Anaerohalosphaeraceae bacterium]